MQQSDVGSSSAGPAHSTDSALDRIELESLILVRHFEMLRRRNDFYSQLDRAAYLLLRTLEAGGSMDLRSLASALGLDRSTAGHQVSAMAEHGYVRTEPAPGDRRRTMITPTDDGLAAMTSVRKLRRDSTAELLEQWDDDALAALADNFARYNETVKDHYLAPLG
ncbi:MarR family winged helix-turn-helix transcriptional regulator [Spelaeicoccus albus]|uniref:DNA-binding MarR family transcriptional regulator n=1 Tax=Spelaeicoccus albus TaxID=1280376 RepID=A0A7Z0D2P9_9MICO|nr:MarR family transcriptional regulator [Spelaeicoccus albus]NYI67784.1 DNA-binding MarR family transcriptional regulator [Spelaeicoccus albus]